MLVGEFCFLVSGFHHFIDFIDFGGRCARALVMHIGGLTVSGGLGSMGVHLSGIVRSQAAIPGNGILESIQSMLMVIDLLFECFQFGYQLIDSVVVLGVFGLFLDF